MTDEPAPDPGVAPFVGMDVYLFDQLVRGRVAPGARVLDVGAGSGRNIVWLLEQGYEVTAVEPREDAWLAMEERLGARGLSAEQPSWSGHPSRTRPRPAASTS